MPTFGDCAGAFARCSPALELRTVVHGPYTYEYVLKASRQEAGIIQNHENGNVGDIGRDEGR